MLTRLSQLIRYNRDWPKYLLASRLRHRPDELLYFRLRNGQKISVPGDARFTLNEIYLDHVYDVPGVELAKCRTILDLGANVGIFALYASSRAPDAQVHCFEPESHTFSLLQRNLLANQARATAYKIAVSGRCGTAHLQQKGTSVQHSLGSQGETSEAVECVDMARVFALTKTERFDFVKMDIEGAELEVLDHCTDEQLRRIGALSMEWHHSTEKLENFAIRLRALGFQASPQIVDGGGRFLKARLL